MWKGGLGVWGGILFGCLAGAVIVRRSGNSVFRFMDAVAPGLLLAQGIGRIGNWWNQELFGKPTDLPWGLEIDPEHRPVDHLADATFHPTFLYELVYDCAMVARAAAARPPLPLQAARAVRALREHLHVRPLLRGAAADRPVAPLAGLRLNGWVSIVVFVLSTAFFIWWQFFHRGRAEAPTAAAAHDGTDDGDPARTPLERQVQFTGFNVGPTMCPKWPGGSAPMSCVKCAPYQTTTSWPSIRSPSTNCARFAA